MHTIEIGFYFNPEVALFTSNCYLSSYKQDSINDAIQLL